jgi:hypothetical protein
MSRTNLTHAMALVRMKGTTFCTTALNQTSLGGNTVAASLPSNDKGSPLPLQQCKPLSHTCCSRMLTVYNVQLINVAG